MIRTSKERSILILITSFWAEITAMIYNFNIFSLLISLRSIFFLIKARNMKITNEIDELW